MRISFSVYLDETASLFGSARPDMTEVGAWKGGILTMEKLQCDLKFSHVASGVVDWI